MANIKSQIKRNKQNNKRRLRNRVYRGAARVAVRNAQSALDSGNAEDTQATILKAISALDIAAQKGVVHRNNAARRKGRLMKRMAALNVDLKSIKVESSTTVKKEPTSKKATTKKAAKKAASKKTSKKVEAKKKTATKKATAKKSAKKKAASKKK